MWTIRWTSLVALSLGLGLLTWGTPRASAQYQHGYGGGGFHGGSAGYHGGIGGGYWGWEEEFPDYPDQMPGSDYGYYWNYPGNYQGMPYSYPNQGYFGSYPGYYGSYPGGYPMMPYASSYQSGYYSPNQYQPGYGPGQFQPGYGYPGGPTKTVLIDENGFMPNKLEIKLGTKVRWTNNSDKQHALAQPFRKWTSRTLGNGQTYTWTFTEPGSYEIQDANNDKMKMTIVVKGAEKSPSDKSPTDKSPTDTSPVEK